MAKKYTKYKAEFNKENYDSISIRVKKTHGELIKTKADEMKMPISRLIITALEKNYLLDLSKD